MAVTYFVQMVAKEGQADNILDLLLVSPKCIEEGMVTQYVKTQKVRLLRCSLLSDLAK